MSPQAGKRVLRAAEMLAADQAAMRDGVPGIDLMERAGKAVAQTIVAWPRVKRVLVLCGPGNNGGDGFVVARTLRAAGLQVLVACLAAPTALKGDAAHMAAHWAGPIDPLRADLALDVDVVVDAIFGIGLNKPVSADLAALFARIVAASLPVVAVDVPTGVDADTGAIVGGDIVGGDIIGGDAAGVLPAVVTVTFAARKPAHLLMPSRALCGEVVVADIGVLPRHFPVPAAGLPVLLETGAWAVPPPPAAAAHKFSRGHAVVASGPVHATGAARLVARAALRAGAGLVTVLSPPEAVAVNASQLTAVMVRPVADADAFAAAVAEPRVTAVGLGPGQGVGPATAEHVLRTLAAAKPAVLDADALTSFAGDPSALFQAVRGPVVLTPHWGEFRRLFPDAPDGQSRPDLALWAAGRSRSVVLLKGADTCIAAPDGRVAINTSGNASLATAGSGDVLAGIILGLLAEPGADPFTAACAGAWLHGRTAELLDRGLIAEDLVEALPRVFAAL